MLRPLLPRTIDNTFEGQKPALWLFGLLVLLKSAMSLNSIFNGRLVAQSADGIPIDTFTAAGAQAVVALFGIWGLGHLMLCLISLLALIRYRALVPGLFAVLLLEHLARKVLLHVHPIARDGSSPGFAVNLGLLVLTVVGLALSLWPRGKPRGQS